MYNIVKLLVKNDKSMLKPAYTLDKANNQFLHEIII